MVLEHGFGVLAVDGLVVRHFLLEVEPRLLDHVPHNVVAWLDAGFFGDVGKVVQERPQVDPGPSRLEDLVDQLDKVQDVVGTVDEETGGDNLQKSDLSLECHHIMT